MKNKIDERLKLLAAEGRTGLMTHIVVGYPDLEISARLVEDMFDNQVDFIELQIPFSDPIADGPTIQHACEAALDKGVRVHDAFAMAGALSGKSQVPLLFMTYYNIVFKYGVKKFCADAAKAGISGLIVPDIPIEAAEHEGFLYHCRANGIHNIPTVAPTSTVDRLKKNASTTNGFVYCMSRQGITGAHQGFDPKLETYLRQVREHIKAPLALGFGISSRERLRSVVPFADIAVVGSAAIDIVTNSKPDSARENVRAFITTLTEELRLSINRI